MINQILSLAIQNTNLIATAVVSKYSTQVSKSDDSFFIFSQPFPSQRYNETTILLNAKQVVNYLSYVNFRWLIFNEMKIHINTMACCYEYYFRNVWNISEIAYTSGLYVISNRDFHRLSPIYSQLIFFHTVTKCSLKLMNGSNSIRTL